MFSFKYQSLLRHLSAVPGFLFLPELCQEHELIPRMNRCLCGSLCDILCLHWRSSISRGDSNLLHSVSRSRGIKIVCVFLFVPCHFMFLESNRICSPSSCLFFSVVWSFFFFGLEKKMVNESNKYILGFTSSPQSGESTPSDNSAARYLLSFKNNPHFSHPTHSHFLPDRFFNHALDPPYFFQTHLLRQYDF